MLRRAVYVSVLFFVVLTGVTAYGIPESGYETRTVRDQLDREVVIPADPRRVISAHGPTTSFLYIAGVEERLVAAGFLGARDPRGRRAMEVIDPRFPGIMQDGVYSQRSFNVEEALRLEVDLVIAGARSSWVETVERAGIPVVLFDAESESEIIAAMELVGEIFGSEAARRGDAWIEQYRTVLATRARRNAGISREDRPGILFTGPDPLQVATGAMYQDAIIEIAGGRNVAQDVPGFWTNVGVEQIALWDPDVILVPAYGSVLPEDLSQQPGWATLRAVRENRVFRMPKLVAPWDTPTPDSLLGIVWLAAMLDPDDDGSDCREAVVAYYGEFYDYQVRDLDYFCGASTER